MTTLLAIYALGRALVKKPWWAVVATGVIAASMPLIYFSRDTYSEPLAATFTFGGLALLWLALKTQQRSIWFLAGLVAGAGTITRIDGFLTIAEMLLFIAVFVGLSIKKDRNKAIRNAANLVAGMSLAAIIGWLDLRILSPAYFQDLAGDFKREVLAILIALVFGIIFWGVAWKTPYLKLLDKRTGNWRDETIVLGFLLMIAVLLSRVYWYHPVAAAGHRSLAEQSMSWLSWYLGPLVALLALFGAILAIVKILRKQSMLLLASLIVIVGTSAVYLIKPSIAPDQIWASRRLLPVILPGVAILATLALDWWHEQYIKRLKLGHIFAAMAGFSVIFSVLVISKPVITLRSYTQLAAIQDICNTLPNNAAILWVGVRPSQEIVQPTLGICQVPTQGFLPENVQDPTTKQLSKIAMNAAMHDKKVVIGVYGDQVTRLPERITKNLSSENNVFQFEQLEYSTSHAPQTRVSSTYSVKFGLVRTDGAVTPLQ
jgi:hypothetical protein